MIEVKFKAPNLQRKLKQLGKLTAAHKKALAKSLVVDGAAVLADSKKKPPRVPVDTGALQSTGHLMLPEIDANGVRVAIQYGGFAGPPWNREVDYAEVMHEDTSRKHRRPGAGAKFVSTHLEARNNEIERNAIKALDTATTKTML